MRRTKNAGEHYAVAEFPSQAAADMAAWSGEPKKAAPKKGTRSWDRRVVREELDAFLAEREWGGAKPSHFVELYVRLHGEVYGVEPLDLRTKKALGEAAMLAARALKQLFDGDRNALADFMRWVWVKQSTEEKQRRQGARIKEFRVTWRYQWAAALVTDYRRAAVTAQHRTAR